MATGIGAVGLPVVAGRPSTAACASPASQVRVMASVCCVTNTAYLVHLGINGGDRCPGSTINLRNIGSAGAGMEVIIWARVAGFSHRKDFFGRQMPELISLRGLIR